MLHLVHGNCPHPVLFNASRITGQDNALFANISGASICNYNVVLLYIKDLSQYFWASGTLFSMFSMFGDKDDWHKLAEECKEVCGKLCECCIRSVFL